ncbi:reverse transcriptase [Plakobranchus ocellatus]|uniref:Reverse transcriptase n=1 Tax=Plakobranchus ocellatus TaxID=259542 RepID=A0AAV3YL74_9GAST|nr:reverse transcriptase [Plakobranchus ocellatus]
MHIDSNFQLRLSSSGHPGDQQIKKEEFVTVKGLWHEDPQDEDEMSDHSKDRLQRSAQSDRTSENQGQIQNHSAEEIHASDPDEELWQLLNANSQKIQFPPASTVRQ